MLINFFDFLTAPLMTLTVPLYTVLLLGIKRGNGQQKVDFRKKIADIILPSLTWAIGYGICWVTKWVLATLFTSQNIIMDAIKQSIFRVKGDETEPFNRIVMLKNNIRFIFPPIERRDNKKYLLGILILSALLLLAMTFILIKYGNYKLLLYHLLPFLFIAIYPYVWYNILGNHSYTHMFFTYRSQMGTIFGLCALYFYSVAMGNKRNMQKELT